MNTPTVAVRSGSGTRRDAILAILVGGLVAGSIDIGAAALINMMDPRVILKFIAGGLQGKAALHGGAASTWLGLFLQWGMGWLIAAIFVFAALRLRWLTARWFVAGLACGAVVFVVMNYVVMPLSAWHHVNHFMLAKALENLAAMLLFGLIVAFATQRFLGKR